MNVILPQNQKCCLRLLDQEVTLHHLQSSTISVSPPREREVGQNHQLNRKLQKGLLLDREVDLDRLKNLMGSPVHLLRKEVSPTLLQILKPRHEAHLGRGVTLDHLQRLTVSPELLLGAVGLPHPLKLKKS